MDPTHRSSCFLSFSAAAVEKHLIMPADCQLMDRHLPLDNARLRVVGFRDQVAHLAYQLELSYFLPNLCIHRRIISDIGLGLQYLVGSD